MNYEKLLEGKKALITAGADGIGYAIARRFEKAGAPCLCL
jgi:NAD(P)-dependent dehydrogenase (short-subunit alcohol dehydrogenase family)